MKTIKTLIPALVLVCLAFVFTTCKKYPESRYWGNPTKAKNCPFYGSITKYTVNGIDSLDLLDKYLDSTSANLTNTPTKVKDATFSFYLRASGIDVVFGLRSYVTYQFSSDKKKITISFTTKFPLQKNLFVVNGTEWDIIRLSKGDDPFKIKTTLNNGNTYEIQIR
ncbi:MAG: hypothetical protein KF900_00735 [Bacteroidetes bacterium]|nr:hypothetical protein [Bacteroidota bacterium]